MGKSGKREQGKAQRKTVTVWEDKMAAVGWLDVSEIDQLGLPVGCLWASGRGRG